MQTILKLSADINSTVSRGWQKMTVVFSSPASSTEKLNVGQRIPKERLLLSSVVGDSGSDVESC